MDKMCKIERLDEPCDKVAENFDPADYAKKVFGMFGGEETKVKLRMDNSLAGVAIDRFGKDAVLIKDGEERFTVCMNVALSPVFYGWLFQFGDIIDILSPDSLKNEMKDRAGQLLAKLEK